MPSHSKFHFFRSQVDRVRRNNSLSNDMNGGVEWMGDQLDWSNHEQDDFFTEEPGSTPGTLRIDPDAPTPEIIAIDYSRTHWECQTLAAPADCEPLLELSTVTWLDVRGLGSEETLRDLGQVFRLHPLTLEDITNVPQRPKVEIEDDRVLVLVQMLSPRAKGRGYCTEQVSLLLGANYVLTVQEEPERDAFDPVRERLRTGRGIIRRMGADYLLCALLDAIVDACYPAMDYYGQQIERLEQAVLFEPDRRVMREIYAIERDLLTLRRWIAPQAHAIAALIREEHPLIHREVRAYLQECYEHATDILEVVTLYQELAVNLMSLYMSSVSNRMNEIMKVLTIVSAIFIPLTFIAGIYGMNFNTETSPFNMPELNWRYGYWICWGMMIVIAGFLVFYFWRRGWFNNSF